MNCEMCGKETELVKAVIEGTELNVCPACSSFGKVIGRARVDIQRKTITKPAKIEEELSIASGFGRIVRQKREEMGLNQKEFSMRLSERESIIHKIENEEIVPDMALAAKLEKALGIRLIEKEKTDSEPCYKTKKEDLTIGDLIKVKKR